MCPLDSDPPLDLTPFVGHGNRPRWIESAEPIELDQPRTKELEASATPERPDSSEPDIPSPDETKLDRTDTTSIDRCVRAPFTTVMIVQYTERLTQCCGPHSTPVPVSLVRSVARDSRQVV